MKPAALTLVLAFLLFFSFLGVPAFSQEIPVNLKADNLKYIEGSRFVEATGSVEVEIKGIKIFADRLIMDQETNIATAEGHVKMVAATYYGNADSLTYFADDETTSFKGFSTAARGSKMKGLMYLSADEVIDYKSRREGKKGRLTSCEDEEEHYYLLADTITLYPGDKVIGYNATLFVGEVPVYWLPIIYYDLNEQSRRNWTFGHNEVEGDYLKSSWAYPLGVLYVDHMEKKGWGLGTHSPYQLGLLGAGTLYLYNVNEKDTGITDWVSRLSHSKQLDEKTTLNVAHQYNSIYLVPSGRRDLTSFSLGLDHKDTSRWSLKLDTNDDRIGNVQKYAFNFNQAKERESLNYQLNYDFAKNDPAWIRSSQRLDFKTPVMRDNIMLSTRFNYSSNVATSGQSADEKLEPFFELTGREKEYSWRITQNMYLDFDKDTYVGDENYQYFEKTPEIEISPNSYNFNGVGLTSSLSYGKYHEVRYVSAIGANRDYTAEKIAAKLDLSKRVPLGLGTVAVLGVGLNQNFYSPGDQFYTYRERASLNTNWLGFFSNTVTYGKGSTDGNTPFLFDQLGTSYHNVNETMTFNVKNKMRLTLSGGHNWQTHQWFDSRGSLLITPNEAVSWNLSSAWSIEERLYRDLINSVTVSPTDFFSTKFSSTSDLNNGNLKSGTVIYDLALLKDQRNQWRFRLGQVYDSLTDEFKVRDIMVVKDLHCWELSYRYSDLNKEYSLTFSLKAMPDDPIGMSSGRGFYIESFDKLEKEITGLKNDGGSLGRD